MKSRLPKTGENHHALRARRLAEHYTSDERLLATIELHDRPYAIWRRQERGKTTGVSAFDRMTERIPDLDLSCASSSSTGRPTARTLSRSGGSGTGCGAGSSLG